MTTTDAATSSKVWAERWVLVTGCTGFLGSWLSGRLVEFGAHVIGMVRDQVPESWLFRSGAAERMTLVFGDLEDAPFVQRVFNDYPVSAVFHLAAQSQVGAADRSPVPTFRTNIMGTWNLLDACRTSPIGQLQAVIIASSDKAYGEQPLPYTEVNPLLGRYPYDVSKACTDLLAQAAAHADRLPIGITRCVNLYGGGDLNLHRLVPETIRMLLQGRRPIIRSDGTFARDYLYVTDAVSAYLSLAETVLRGRHHGEAFNFGTGHPARVLDVVSVLIEIAQRPDLAPDIRNEAQGEIREQSLNSDKATRLLSWRPRVSLREGLEQTFRWYQQHRPWETLSEEPRVPTHA